MLRPTPRSLALLATLPLLACSTAADRTSSGSLPDVRADGSEAQGHTKKPKGDRLFDLAPEPPGAHCPNGGHVFMTGYDANDNGVLDPSEVLTRSYACNGVDGRTPVLATRDEPIGTACPTGGQAISWGYDDNENHVLDAAEIAQTAYVCNGRAGADGHDGKASLVTLLPQSPNAHCPTGGQGIYVGLDLDGDGLLQPTEVKATSFVCNGATGQQGAAGKNALVRTTDEPIGPNCANGGLRVLSGLDANGDAILSDAEVTSTSYACHGAPGQQGAQGAPGISTLVVATAEPGGTNCADGGQRLDVGQDVDGDGVLDPGEIAQTRYVCNGGGGAIPLLHRQTEFEKHDTCRYGGFRVEAGFDLSGNGTLDPAEISTTMTLCELTREVNATCPEGTYGVEGGLDRNGDGMLSNDEVSWTRCQGYRSLAAGRSVTCGTRTEGSPRCWGYNSAGGLTDAFLPVTPAGVPEAIAVSTSSAPFGTCAIRHDGTVLCWAPDLVSAAVRKDGVIGAATIALGWNHACVLLTDGTVRCWGDSSSGQLGHGAWTGSIEPVVVSGLVGVTSIAAGAAHSCAVIADGSLQCWGYNWQGQLGDGTVITSRPAPVVVPGLTGVVAAACGFAHTCARRDDGTMWCWGKNVNGQLGDGTTKTRSTPTQVPGLDDVTSIATGDSHSCATLGDGSARCWGLDDFFQLGDRSKIQQLTPAVVTGVSEARAITAGGNHTCALMRDGHAECWGLNANGQLGIGWNTAFEVAVPTRVVE